LLDPFSLKIIEIGTPQLVIGFPARFRVGQVITVRGSATDPEGCRSSYGKQIGSGDG